MLTLASRFRRRPFPAQEHLRNTASADVRGQLLLNLGVLAAAFGFSVFKALEDASGA
jgi:hypothetical protein